MKTTSLFLPNPTRRRTFLAMVAFVVTTATIFCVAQAQVLKTRLHREMMEKKLISTQRVMEGIARADFDMIEKHSQSLHLVSREAGWNVLATPTYLRLSEDFRATTTQLERAAEKKNLDAVGLAYVKLSISCIECHRYARKEMPRIGMRIPDSESVASR